jgi:hypothetical protein
MSSRLVLSVALSVAAFSPARIASADACVALTPEAARPVELGTLPGELGQLPMPCVTTELGLDSSAALLVATEDFYGSIQAGAMLAGSFALGSRTWLSFSLPGLDYRWVANATIEAGAADLGAGTLGWHMGWPLGPNTAVSSYLRLLLPTETVYRHATRHGFEHGVVVTSRLGSRFALVGGVSFPTLLVAGPGTVLASYQPTVGSDLVMTPATWFAVAAGAGLRWRFGDDAAFESFDPRLALRLYPWRGSRVEVRAALPLGGADRTDVMLGLTLGWLWERPN